MTIISILFKPLRSIYFYSIFHSILIQNIIMATNLFPYYFTEQMSECQHFFTLKLFLVLFLFLNQLHFNLNILIKYFQFVSA